MLKVADIVRSRCGRDAGRVFFVVGIQDDRCLLADGRVRRVEKPKAKKPRHVELIQEGQGKVGEKLRSGEKVSNSELRRALADIQSPPEGEVLRHGER